MPETTNFSPTPALAAPYPPRAVAWYATLMLALMYWLSILDRLIISLMVGPIKRDLGITDTQFGMLSGLSFAVTFCLFGLIAGALADRFARRWVIFAGISIWSIATAVCGLTHNFWQLLGARVGVGAGEAALTPAATSILTDMFPREKLTSALAVYSIGAMIGSGCAFLLGGMIVDLVSQTESIVLPIVGEVRSWQGVFLMVGIPGILLSFLIFTMPEPQRRGESAVAKQGWLFWVDAYRDLLKFIKLRRHFFSYHYTGFAFATCIVSGSATWYPAHMSRTFGWSFSQIGLTLGLMLALGGLASQLICGRAVDALYQRGFRDAPFRFYAGCLVVATPLGIIGCMSSNPWVFIGFQSAFIVLVSALAACTMSSLNLVTPNALRGSGVAFYSATAGLVGAASGSVLIAAVSDHVFHSESAIGLGIATVIGICCPIAAVLLALGCRAMHSAVLAAEELSMS